MEYIFKFNFNQKLNKKMSANIQGNKYNDSDEKLCIKQFEIDSDKKTNQELP